MIVSCCPSNLQGKTLTFNFKKFSRDPTEPQLVLQIHANSWEQSLLNGIEDTVVSRMKGG